MINLGDKVKDPITGYTGIAYCKTTYLQGCDRIGIQALMVQKKEELPEVPELYHVDERQLEILDKVKIMKDINENGGPSGFGSSNKQKI